MTRTLSFVLTVVAVVASAYLFQQYYFEDSDFNMNEIEAIAKNTVKSPKTGEMITVESFWEKQPCVITFFRRFGCAFCRVAAKELSKIKPLLDENNVRLIGIGVEELGAEEFMEGKFFDGELYIDLEKKCYKDLKYKRYGLLNLLPALFVKTSRDAVSKASSENLGGNLKGDYYQVGGTLVISAGGEKVLLSQRQESLADHVDPNEVLKSLGINATVPVDDKQDAAQMCTTEACSN